MRIRSRRGHQLDSLGPVRLGKSGPLALEELYELRWANAQLQQQTAEAAEVMEDITRKCPIDMMNFRRFYARFAAFPTILKTFSPDFQKYLQKCIISMGHHS